MFKPLDMTTRRAPISSPDESRKLWRSGPFETTVTLPTMVLTLRASGAERVHERVVEDIQLIVGRLSTTCPLRAIDNWSA